MSVKDILVDFLMYLCISFMALKILKSIRINSRNQVLFLFLFVFVFHSQYFYNYALIHQLLLLIYTHENKYQLCRLRHCILNFHIFSFKCIFYWFYSSFVLCSLQLITLCSLNPKLLLNLYGSDVLQCIIKGIIIPSWAYTNFSSPINSDLSFLHFLICYFVELLILNFFINQVMNVFNI